MYITPRVLIQQEFTQIPVYREDPLPAFIIGPHFALTRYSEASEKPFTALGTLDGEAILTGNTYVPTEDVRYDVPNVPAGGNTDHSYTKVFAESVEALYFPLAELGSTASNANDVEKVATSTGKYFTNKVRFPNAVLKTANGFDRSAFFADRDVRAGDLIELTDNLGNNIKAKIQRLELEGPEADPDLKATIAPVFDGGTDGAVTAGQLKKFVSATADFTDEAIGKYITIDTVGTRKIVGRENATTLLLNNDVPEGTSYDFYIDSVYADEDNYAFQSASVDLAYPSGQPTLTGSVVKQTETYVGYNWTRILEDVYTIIVEEAGSSLADLRFSITSQNGAFSPKTNVALTTDGADEHILIVDNTLNSGNNISLDFTGVTAGIVVGCTWTVTAKAAVAKALPVTPEPEVGGNPNPDYIYLGPTDMVYKVKVERGGAFYDGTNSLTCARLLITSTNVDTTSVVLPKLNESFTFGSYGVSAKFTAAANNGGLIANDVFYIPVYAPKPGRYSIVQFDEDMPELMTTVATSIEAKLYLSQASINIPRIKDLMTDERNWEPSENYITINQGITTYDNGLVVTSEPVRLPITAAKLFVEHRDLLQDYVNAIDSVRSLAEVSTKLGTIHPDNPLAQGVYDAVLNAQNQVVYFIGVVTNDLPGYTNAIKISEKSDKVYSFVPMTFDRTIQDAVISHVNAYSTPEVGRWRIAWISVEDKKTSVIYDLKSDEVTPYTATVSDDPTATGTQYKMVNVVGARFIEDGVRPNDTVRMNFRLNADGELTFDEYVVDQVRTNTSLTITQALSAPVSVPTKIQVVRHYTKSERARNIAYIGGEFNNRRVRCVFPDTFKYGNVEKPGYIAAAGLAGLRSGVVPHQGLTNSEYLGADDLSKVVVEFSQDDLNVMAEQGIWLITQEVVGATPYVRHQLTTDESSLNTSEDSITTNVDSISYALKRTLEPFIGRYNINPENLLVVRDAVINELNFRAVYTRTARAGNQLVSFDPLTDIIRLEQNSTYKDRIDVEVKLHVPYPLNYINLKLIV